MASIEEAAAYTGADYRIGERGSVKVRGFDFDNSPTEIEVAELPPGATVVLSTNRTRIIEAARGAEILAGIFVNAPAVADELATGAYGGRVAVVGCGWEGRRASEDESAAGAILYRLREWRIGLDEWARRVVDLYLARSKESLRRNSVARLLTRLGYEQDLDFCLAEITVPVVPRFEGDAFVSRR